MTKRGAPVVRGPPNMHLKVYELYFPILCNGNITKSGVGERRVGFIAAPNVRRGSNPAARLRPPKRLKSARCALSVKALPAVRDRATLTQQGERPAGAVRDHRAVPSAIGACLAAFRRRKRPRAVPEPYPSALLMKAVVKYTRDKPEGGRKAEPARYPPGCCGRRQAPEALGADGLPRLPLH
jgi:hypothetical protein